MINNRHGPHPAVSYYRSGAPPGCDIACIDNRLYEVEWERCARAAPVITKIRDALALLYAYLAAFVVKHFPNHREHRKDTEKILCIQTLAALCDSLAPEVYRDAERILYMVNNAYELVMT